MAQPLQQTVLQPQAYQLVMASPPLPTPTLAPDLLPTHQAPLRQLHLAPTQLLHLQWYLPELALSIITTPLPTPLVVLLLILQPW